MDKTCQSCSFFSTNAVAGIGTVPRCNRKSPRAPINETDILSSEIMREIRLLHPVSRRWFSTFEQAASVNELPVEQAEFEFSEDQTAEADEETLDHVSQLLEDIGGHIVDLDSDAVLEDAGLSAVFDYLDAQPRCDIRPRKPISIKPIRFKDSWNWPAKWVGLQQIVREASEKIGSQCKNWSRKPWEEDEPDFAVEFDRSQGWTPDPVYQPQV